MVTEKDIPKTKHNIKNQIINSNIFVLVDIFILLSVDDIL